MNRKYWVYIIGNQRPVLYIGITNNLVRRIYEHKQGLIEGFSKTYKLKMLLYYEEYEDVNKAIQREKNLKKWKREWKLKLIREFNPAFEDLYKHINQ